METKENKVDKGFQGNHQYHFIASEQDQHNDPGKTKNVTEKYFSKQRVTVFECRQKRRKKNSCQANATGQSSVHVYTQPKVRP